MTNSRWLTLGLIGFLATAGTSYWYGRHSVPLSTQETVVEKESESKSSTDADKKGLIEFRLTTVKKADGSSTTIEEHGVVETEHTETKIEIKEVEKVVEKVVIKEADSPRNKLALLMPPKYGSPEYKEIRLTYGYRVVGPWSVEVAAGIDGTVLIGLGYSW